MNNTIRSLENRLFCRNKGNMTNSRLFLFYSVFFALLSLFSIGIYFIVFGKSTIWLDDGIKQHFVALTYYGQYLRQIFKTLISEGKLIIPEWSNSLGFGSDVLTTLHYYVMGDPLNLLSAVVPSVLTEYLYAFLIFLRIYLSGLSFICYSLYGKENDRFAVLCGSLCYSFCGYVMFSAVRHPYFINPMIYFPLICLGADKIMDDKRPYLFIVSSSVAAISNFYLFFIQCVMLVLYVLIRFFSSVKQSRIKRAFTLFYRFALCLTVAACISSFILIPEVKATLFSNRFSVKNFVPVTYELIYYLKMLSGFGNVSFNSYWLVLGFNAVSIFCCAVMFASKKKYLSLKISFIVLTVFGLVPYIGHLLNGMSYVTNRWCFVFPFLMSIITVKLLPDIHLTDLKTALKGLSVILIWFLLCITFSQTRASNTMITIILVAVLFIYLILINSAGFKKGYYEPLFAVVLCVSVLVNGAFRYSVNGDNYIKVFADRGEALKMMTSASPLNYLADIGDDNFWRYEADSTSDIVPNSNILNKLKADEYYYSLADSHVSDFCREMWLDTCYDNWFNDLGGRSNLEALTCTKYYIHKYDQKSAPYLFDDNVISVFDSDRNLYPDSYYWYIYEANDTLPFGYTYEYRIDADVYDSMDPVQKQQALLQGVVLNESRISLPLSEIVLSDDTVLEVNDFTKTVIQANDTITFKYSAPANCETYLLLEGFDYTDLSKKELNAINIETENEKIKDPGQKLKVSGYDKSKAAYDDLYKTRKTEVELKISSPRRVSEFVYLTKNNNFYSGRHDFLFNLGYSDTEINDGSVNIKVSETGRYEASSVRIVCQQMSSLYDSIDILKKESLQNVRFDADGDFSGNITVSKDKFLLIPITYSEGWSAMIDSNPTPVVRANTMFMGIVVPEGTHDVTFEYDRPFSVETRFISCFGLFCFAAVITVTEIRKKKDRGTR